VARRSRPAGSARALDASASHEAILQISRDRDPAPPSYQTVYRRLVGTLSIGDGDIGALRSVVMPGSMLSKKMYSPLVNVAETEAELLSRRRPTCSWMQRLAGRGSIGPAFGSGAACLSNCHS